MFALLRWWCFFIGVAAPEPSAVPKPKKFFKSRNSDSTDSVSPVYDEKSELTYGNTSKKFKAHDEKPAKQPKKFFASKSEKSVLSSNANYAKRTETKPPIVLRICHGKSQLVNDSDESESTPTPSSTPSTSTVTSPRAVQRSPNARITRSTRRSMQQDPNSSPAMADTPGEFSLFTSPKKDDISPQYIPAEEYEQERRALYDTLLGSVSKDVDEEPNQEPSGCIDLNQDSCDKSNSIEEALAQMEEGGEEPMEIENDTIENGILQDRTTEELNESRLEHHVEPPTVEDPQETIPEVATAQENNQNNKRIEDDWSTDDDSDSQSTAPEIDPSEDQRYVKIVMRNRLWIFCYRLI